MIPDYQTLMRSVLECSKNGEVSIGEVVERLAEQYELSDQELAELLPSGRQTRFANRVNWAKSYLKRAGLVEATRRGHFVISDTGQAALADVSAEINKSYLGQFGEFKKFQSRTQNMDGSETSATIERESRATPDEILREAHRTIEAELSADLIGRVRESSADFFEDLVVKLLMAMGYGGTSEDAGRALGRSGDGGVDGVIDQDPLGVDQIYVQAKRYAEGNSIGPGAIRDFFGALNLKKAQKGIFFTTSSFSGDAVQTAQGLGTRMVLIDGDRLASLMIQYDIGCREQDVLRLKKVDESFFEDR